MMFGRVLTRIAGERLSTLFNREVGAKIGLGEFEWWYEETLNGIPLDNGCSGISVTANQLARFGYLFLRQGNWKGEQVISKDWVNQATRPQVGSMHPLADTDRKSTDGRGRYGFNWWTNGNHPDGGLWMPNSPVDLYYMSGLNNNMCFVLPGWDMVVVRMGEDGNPPEGKHVVYNRFFELLGKALVEGK